MRMSASWHVNEGLAPLIAQVKAEHPGIVVGTIGDAAHASEVSDHNPNAAGRVNAADFMLGTHFTENDAIALIPWLIKDPRTHYVIHDRKIWTSETRAWKAYTGTDPHTNHIHESVKDSAHTDSAPWNIGEEMPLTNDDAAVVWNADVNPGDASSTAHGVLWTLYNRVPTDMIARLDTLKAALVTVENDVEHISTGQILTLSDDDVNKIASKVVDLIADRFQS